MVKKMTIAIVACLCLFWVGSILKCEILTLQYGQQFIGLQEQTHMLGESDYLKVLEYSATEARVYYVSSNRSGGDILKFTRQDGDWTYSEWERPFGQTAGARMLSCGPI